VISKVWGLMFQPTATWKSIGEMTESDLRPYLLYPVVLGFIPALAWYFGTTQIGWTVAGKSLTRLTPDSAGLIAGCFYLAQLAAIWIIGYFIHWMSQTYGANTSVIKGVVLAGFTATPLLLAGVEGVYPLLGLDLLIAIFASCYSVYLLYKGIPIAMHMPSERGFLYASAIVGVTLVMVISLMGSTLILWDLGLEPAFQD